MQRVREVIVPGEPLPAVQTHEPAWAVVARVTDRAAHFDEALKQPTSGAPASGSASCPVRDLKVRPVGHLRGLDQESVELGVIAAACAAARELDIELDPEEERIHDADLFRALRVRPGELPMEPLRSGRPI